MSRVKAIPLYLSGDEAKHLEEVLHTFFENDCRDPDRFTFILGQNPFAEDTYLRISYEGLDDVETIVL